MSLTLALLVIIACLVTLLLDCASVCTVEQAWLTFVVGVASGHAATAVLFFDKWFWACEKPESLENRDS